MSTLADCFRAYIDADPLAPACIVPTAGGVWEQWSRRELASRAYDLAAACQARGVRRGDRVVISLSDPRAFVVAFWASQLAGASAVPIPASGPSSNVERTKLLGGILERAAPILIVCDQPTGQQGHLPSSCPVLNYSPEAATFGADYGAQISCDRDIALVQFTSGSTDHPKGCALSHGAIIANGMALIERIGARAGDVSVVWLPLHHDMGLMSGVVAPVLARSATCLLRPSRFMANPLSWLSALSSFERTHSAVPNFALALVLQQIARRGLPPGNLESVKSITCGAEPIDANLVDRFYASLADCHLHPQTFHAAYGMAEVTVMATGRIGELSADTIDVERLRSAGVAEPCSSSAKSIRVVNLGSPPIGTSLRIVDSADRQLDDRQIGEVQLKSSSQMSGYLNDVAGTKAQFCDDWLRTGDLGYLANGELFLVGRRKSLIVVGGRNLAPSDIESAIATAAGVPVSRLAAVGVRNQLGTEEIHLVLEVRKADERLKVQAARACFQACGVAPAKVHLVEPGYLPKTTSGKIRREQLVEKLCAQS